MAGYDLSNLTPFNLIKARLGVYEKQPFDRQANKIEGIDEQYIRLQQMGGNRQQERMIKDKRRSLERAIWNSYQAAQIVKVDATERKPFRALINPNKLKQDYDDKILSVGFEYHVEVGDVFEWVGTNSYWLVYLQELTELAYFRGNIRKCSYELSWIDEDGNKQHTYVAIKGPSERDIDNITKHSISLDLPNYSLELLIPRNEQTLKYFKRYTEFYLNGIETCWRISAVDSISTPGIIEVVAQEYYANSAEDDIKNGIVGGKIKSIKNPNEGEIEDIIGETFIQVKQKSKFTFKGTRASVWEVDKDVPVILTIDKKDPRNVVVYWDSNYSGQFELRYGNSKKIIVVQSLF